MHNELNSVIGRMLKLKDSIRRFNLTDVDAPIFTHTTEFREHFDYIKSKIIELIINKDSNASFGVELIAEERERQIRVEGWSAMHDSEHDYDQLATAGAVYALPDRLRNNINRNGDLMPSLWPWEREWWKPVPNDRVRELVKAGALIAAEIDRLNSDKNVQLSDTTEGDSSNEAK